MSYSPHLQRMSTPPDKVRAADGGISKDIYRAAIEGDIECLQANIDAGADLNALGKPAKIWGHRFEKSSAFQATPLQFATSYNRMLAVEMLLKSGADTNVKSCAGFTAKDYAVMRGYDVITSMLESFS